MLAALGEIPLPDTIQQRITQLRAQGVPPAQLISFVDERAEEIAKALASGAGPPSPKEIARRVKEIKAAVRIFVQELVAVSVQSGQSIQ